MRSLSAVLLLVAQIAWAAPESKVPVTPPASYPVLKAMAELPLKSKYSRMTDDLTTEKIWVLDPDVLNPHRQRWILNRNVKLHGLRVREIPGAPRNARFGVVADDLVSQSLAYFRGPGPWYRPMRDFPCAQGSFSWFATLDGAHKAADVSAEEWERMLLAERPLLLKTLNRVAASTPQRAQRLGEMVYRSWYMALDRVWRDQGRARARQAEWRFYEKVAAEKKVCSSSFAFGNADRKGGDYEDEFVPASKVSVPWEMLMEPPATGKAGLAGTNNEMSLLARAPAKRFDGLFSIRLNVTVGDRRLNGRFLVDSGVPTSVVSPEWLTNQGILPAWVEIPGVPLQPVPWAGGEAQGGVAPLGMMDLVEVGSFPLQLKDFLVFDTEFFGPPATTSSCCDGVLGADFLRRYVVELQPGPPAEVKIWPAAGFHLPEDKYQWIEAGSTPDGEVVSSCFARNNHATHKLDGARWDSGREAAIDVHTPWKKTVGDAVVGPKSDKWDVYCGPMPADPLVRGAQASFPTPGVDDVLAVQKKAPAFSLGMAFLGRTRVFFDLPHGRIWFPKDLGAKTIAENRSGLEVKFATRREGKYERRVLVVDSIKPGSVADEALKARGIARGDVVNLINSEEAAEMNTWDVDQLLSGVRGNTLTIQFKTRKGLRLAQLKLK